MIEVKQILKAETETTVIQNASELLSIPWIQEYIAERSVSDDDWELRPYSDLYDETGPCGKQFILTHMAKGNPIGKALVWTSDKDHIAALAKLFKPRPYLVLRVS